MRSSLLTRLSFFFCLPKISFSVTSTSPAPGSSKPFKSAPCTRLMRPGFTGSSGLVSTAASRCLPKSSFREADFIISPRVISMPFPADSQSWASETTISICF